MGIVCYLQIAEELPQRRWNSISLRSLRKHIWLNIYKTHFNWTTEREFCQVRCSHKRLASLWTTELVYLCATNSHSDIFFTLLAMFSCLCYKLTSLAMSFILMSCEETVPLSHVISHHRTPPQLWEFVLDETHNTRPGNLVLASNQLGAVFPANLN